MIPLLHLARLMAVRPTGGAPVDSPLCDARACEGRLRQCPVIGTVEDGHLVTRDINAGAVRADDTAAGGAWKGGSEGLSAGDQPAVEPAR